MRLFMFKAGKFENNFLFTAVASLLAFLILFTRRTDAVLNPQFWAEDGSVWYSQAYNQGAIYSLLTVEAAYYQTISRLTAIFSQIFPLAYAPLIFNFVAIGTKIVVVNFLLSSRFSKLIPSISGRVLLAFIYLALPHSYETHANLTNVQWHLALLSCLIIIVPASDKRAWEIFDFSIVSLSTLSGPFCLLLLPVAAIKFWRDKTSRLFTILIIISIGCLIQGFSLLTAERPSQAPLGANLNLFLKIIGGHLFVSSILGENGLLWLINHSLWKDGTIIMANLFGFSVIGYGFWKANLELRLLILFSALICLGAFLSPAITNEKPQWELMWYPATGSRYWLVPIFCFITTLFYLATKEKKPFVRYTAALMLVLSLIGISSDWTYPPFKDLNFPAYAEQFENAPVGEEVVIPINPDWDMRLKKK
jgi:hypothetical protein